MSYNTIPNDIRIILLNINVPRATILSISLRTNIIKLYVQVLRTTFLDTIYYTTLVLYNIFRTKA